MKKLPVLNKAALLHCQEQHRCSITYLPSYKKIHLFPSDLISSECDNRVITVQNMRQQDKPQDT
jgi:hypothetical protein